MGSFQHIKVEEKGPVERKDLEEGGENGILSTFVRICLGREKRNREIIISSYVPSSKHYTCLQVTFVKNIIGRVPLTGETG